MTFTRRDCPNCGASDALWEQIEETDNNSDALYAVDCDECDNGGSDGPQVVRRN
jgi:hypothetical protein